MANATEPRPQIRPGDRHIRLTVVEYVPGGRGRVHVVCDCGAERAFIKQNWGKTQSCGCLHREQMSAAQTKHGMAGSPTYKAWGAMVQRCTNPRNADYASYGGRGITVCERWRNSFEDFLADMGERPAAELSLDRIDNNKSYGPGNCRWTTQSEQNRNRRPRPLKVACKRGHQLTGTNVYREKDGQRRCRECDRIRDRVWRRRKKEDVASPTT